ncbi:IS1634 family transposase [Spinactinospora alkalitolerans]|uniref:IS1634 family transposase n=1 Tax=Spinactinospora alkalitolerans TaxID=687207 RepID=UPI001C5408C8
MLPRGLCPRWSRCWPGGRPAGAARHGDTRGGKRTKRTEPVWNPEEYPGHWRAIWAYSRKRAVRDGKTLTAQENRARAVIDGDAQVKSTRFVKTTAAGRKLDEKALERARRLVGLKGYVTNIPAEIMAPTEVISSYHDLWHVEQSFRMSKTDLRARPMFHRTRDAIEAHLTIVFTALAMSRYMQAKTGFSIRKIIRTLRPVLEVDVDIGGHTHTATEPLTDDAPHIITAIDTGKSVGH